MHIDINKSIGKYKAAYPDKTNADIAQELFPDKSPKHAGESYSRLIHNHKAFKLQFVIHAIEVFQTTPNEFFNCKDKLESEAVKDLYKSLSALLVVTKNIRNNLKINNADLDSIIEKAQKSKYNYE